MSGLLVALVLLPAAGGLAAAALGAGRAELAGRVGAGVAWACLVLWVPLLLGVASDGRVDAVLERSDGQAVLGLSADPLGVVLLGLIAAVSATVQLFALRYLRGDLRRAAFFARTGVLVAATSAMACAATLVGLALAWSLAGVALCALLALYRGLPAAREGLRRTARSFLIADLALWGAVAVALATWGDLDLRLLGTQGPELAQDTLATTLVACGLVVAAVGRSAQLPLQRWLPATLAAPTPVSALLHAGVVNAGGVLLIRGAPLFGASAVATHLAFALGAATAVTGTALMLTRPDVKGALAHSTMGQMGFMVMTCGLGAFAAAAFHLVAHGLYKSSLFLGSGGAVRRAVRERAATPIGGLGPRAATLWAVGLASGALGVAVAVLRPDTGHGSAALLAFAWVTGAWMARGWLGRRGGPTARAAAAGALLLALGAYVAVADAVTGFLAPSLEGAGTATVSAGWLVLAGAAMAAVTLVVRSERASGAAAALYVAALNAGRSTAARPAGPRARRRPALAPALVLRADGGRA